MPCFVLNIKEDKDTTVQQYREYMLKREDKPLKDGAAMVLANALLELNQYQTTGEPPLLEVAVMPRNSPETGIRVFNNIRQRKMPISRHAFTGEESVVDCLESYDVDLFLTTNTKDARKVIDGKTCAVAVIKEPPSDLAKIPKKQVRIAFDGDAVLFDKSSEIVYKAEGLRGFHENEDSKQDVPMGDGFLRNFATRVIKTLRRWGLCRCGIFLGGLEKAKALRAFKPHISLMIKIRI